MFSLPSSGNHAETSLSSENAVLYRGLNHDCWRKTIIVLDTQDVYNTLLIEHMPINIHKRTETKIAFQRTLETSFLMISLPKLPPPLGEASSWFLVIKKTIPPNFILMTFTPIITNKPHQPISAEISPQGHVAHHLLSWGVDLSVSHVHIIL